MGNNFKKERAFCESSSKKWHVKNAAKIIERLQKDNRIEHMKKGFV